MNKQISDDRDFNMWVMLQQARDTIFKARDIELYKYDLTVMKAGVLFVVEANGGKVTAGEISRWLFREPHSISGLLKRLERQGLLTRARIPGKKNQKLITLTEKGKEAYEKSLNREAIHEIISCLTEEERKQLWPLLQKLRDTALKSLTQERSLPFP